MKHHLIGPRWTALALIVILLGTAWLPRLPAQAANARLDSALGPQLFRIKSAAESQVELAAAGVVAHTRLADGSLLASGPSTAAAALRAAGVAFDLLALDGVDEALRNLIQAPPVRSTTWWMRRPQTPHRWRQAWEASFTRTRSSCWWRCRMHPNSCLWRRCPRRASPSRWCRIRRG